MFEDYKAFKEKVGVDDVAAYLGYKLDRKAGVGKYVEYWMMSLHILAINSTEKLESANMSSTISVMVGDVRLTPLSSVIRATNPARPISIGTEPVAAMPSV